MAYDTAIGVLRREPTCRALFQRLGADGEAVLRRTQYHDGEESRNCEGDVRAFTSVGSPLIKVCHGFAELQASSAALLLLHEALHTSGLPESPGYPNAMSANEISAVVSVACKLQ